MGTHAPIDWVGDLALLLLELGDAVLGSDELAEFLAKFGANGLANILVRKFGELRHALKREWESPRKDFISAQKNIYMQMHPPPEKKLLCVRNSAHKSCSCILRIRSFRLSGTCSILYAILRSLSIHISIHFSLSHKTAMCVWTGFPAERTMSMLFQTENTPVPPTHWILCALLNKHCVSNKEHAARDIFSHQLKRRRSNAFDTSSFEAAKACP